MACRSERMVDARDILACTPKASCESDLHSSTFELGPGARMVVCVCRDGSVQVFGFSTVRWPPTVIVAGLRLEEVR